MEKNYLKVYFSFLAIGIASIVLFNWFINPYSLYESPQINGLNKDKVEYIKHLRLTKPRMVVKNRVNSIILGTSRAGRGLSPSHPAWGNDKVYNLALPDIGIYEMYRYLQHAHASKPIKKAILALDFRSFHDEKPSSAFLENRLLVMEDGQPNDKYNETYFFDTMSTLFSLDALGASLWTIRRQGWNKENLFPNGRWDRTNENVDHRKLFTAYTRATIKRLNEIIDHQKNRPSGLQHFRNLVSYAHNNNIQLIMMVSPSHAWHWEVYQRLGMQEKLNDLKRSLVEINEDEAKSLGEAAFPLWDFSGHNSYSVENVPLSNKKKEKMNWFWESIHYKKRLGDVILDKILGDISSSNQIATDFGVQLTSNNIETHISQLKSQAQTYQKNHLADIDYLSDILQSSK